MQVVATAQELWAAEQIAAYNMYYQQCAMAGQVFSPNITQFEAYNSQLTSHPTVYFPVSMWPCFYEVAACQPGKCCHQCPATSAGSKPSQETETVSEQSSKRAPPNSTLFLAFPNDLSDQSITNALAACQGFTERFFSKDKRGKRVVFAAFAGPQEAQMAIEKLHQQHLFAELSMKPFELGRSNEFKEKDASPSEIPPIEEISEEIPEKPKAYEIKQYEREGSLISDVHGECHHTLFVCALDMGAAKQYFEGRPGFKEFTGAVTSENQKAGWVRFQDAGYACRAIEGFVKLNWGWVVFAKRERRLGPSSNQQPGQRTLLVSLGKAVLQSELEEYERKDIVWKLALGFRMCTRYPRRFPCFV